jgi:hypothetical protein
MKIPRYIVFAMVLVLCFATAVLGQRTTGDLEGKITDPNGAVVPNVSVTLTGVTLGFHRTVQSDDEGEFSIKQIPTGIYRITTVAIGGFAESTTDNVAVTVEKLTVVNIKLALTASTNVVDVSTSDASGVIDPSDSKVQTNITPRMIEQLPKGTNFSSLLRISPATRAEPLSGGFQVDGASGSENSFLIDGLSVENFRTGVLNGVNNIPTALVSEIQIKTGGFEAEHGGASGAVISVVTRSGSDSFHGDFGAAFELDALQPAPRFATSRFVSSSSSSAAIAANPDYLYAIAQKKDDYSNVFPSGTLGGPIVKTHVWFLTSYSPQIFTTTRTSNFINAISNSNFSTGKFVPTPRLDSDGQPLAPITYRSRVKNEYAFTRIDAAFFSNFRGGVTFLWNPEITDGNIPFASITTSNPVNTTYGGVSYNSHDYSALRGGRRSSNNFTSHLEWTPTNRMVVTARYGRAFQNEKGGNYAIPEGVRYTCSGSATAYATIATGCPGGIGYQNLSTNSNTTRDVNTKNEFSADVSYLVNSFGGKHDFTGGYLRGKITNDVLSGYAGTGWVQFYYGQDFAQALPSAASLSCTLGSPSCVGVGSLTRFGTKGIGQNLYQGIYFQDRWQPTSRLTLNLGLRLEKEFLPSFNAGDLLAGTAIPGIEFGWTKKMAPRLGFAYDLKGDGKTKIFASFGSFYDRLKFEAPRGSFGGDFYRVDYFRITAANPAFSFYSPDKILGTWDDPRGGGNPSTSGGLSQLQIDFRIPSNLTTEQFKALGLVVTGVDPDLKPFRQDEFTVGFEREVRQNWVLSTRFTRKNVAHALEDHAILGLNQSENYPVGNPGEGLDLRLDQESGSVKSPKAQRLYRAFEIILNKRLSNHYYFQANYTLGYLFGNYSGLASSDENGRTSPSVDRFFDYPINGYTASGQPDNGYLATDRRHVFKSYGGYEFDRWKSKGHSDDISYFFTAMQGTPQTTFVSVVATSIPLSKRGDLGRTPAFTQTDLSWSHHYNFGNDGRFRLSFDFNVLNVFNQNAVTSFFTTRYRTTNTIGAKDIDPAYNQETQTLIPVLNRILNAQIGTQLTQLENGGLPSLTGRPNPHRADYGLASGYQGARNVRFGLRFSF